MTYVPAIYDEGYWGNSAIVLYSPKTDDHPTVVSGDAVPANFFYCSDFNLYPRYETETGEYINGLPDRNIFGIKPIIISGNIQQKMLARIDGSPDYTGARIYEGCRHAWSGYAYTAPNDGSGVPGIPGSVFAPQFSIFSDIYGVFSECMADSIEFVANSNEQVVVNYGIVAKKLWTEDAPNVRNLMVTLSTGVGANAPMRQVYSTDCGMAVANAEGTPVNGQFALVSGGSSDLLKGYNFPDTSGKEKLVSLKFKIENFLKPNFAMQSHERWANRIDRDAHVQERVQENLWARNFYPEKPRQISGEVVWITDTVPQDIQQRIAGGSSNQIITPSGVVLGESMWFSFGPMVIFIRNPIWSLGQSELLPDKMFKISLKILAATDGELILLPTESWV